MIIIAACLTEQKNFIQNFIRLLQDLKEIMTAGPGPGHTSFILLLKHRKITQNKKS